MTSIVSKNKCIVINGTSMPFNSLILSETYKGVRLTFIKSDSFIDISYNESTIDGNIPSSKAELISFLQDKAFKRGSNPEPPTASKIEITFENQITDATVSTADLKYNLFGVLSMDWDDGSITAVNAAALFDTLFLNDGTGRNINWRAGVAVIGRSWFNNNELGDNTGSNISYAEMQDLISKGWDIENHGLYSKLSITDPFNNGGSAIKDLEDNDALILDRIGYKMKATVVPGSDVGYVQGANTLGHFAVSSQRDDVGEGMPSLPSADWQPLYDLKNANDSFKYFLRFFADGPDWGSSNLTSKLTQLINDSNANVHKLMRIGTHNSDSPEFNTFITNANTAMAGKIWVCSMRELMEYLIVKNKSVVSSTIAGNKLTIEVDYTAVPEDVIFKDLTLLCKDGSNTITGITVNGFNDVTYNTNTGLINIYSN